MRIGNKTIKFAEMDSTNNFLDNFSAKTKAPEGTVVITDNQTAGRGQHFNTWESEAGKNLTFSVLLYPSFLEAHQQFLLSQTVALGIYDWLVGILKKLELSIEPLRIKWPNDIYYGNKKLGGILIENSILANRITKTIVGIGLNINQQTFSSSTPNAISLTQITKQQYEISKIQFRLFAQLSKRYDQLKQNVYTQIKSNYHEILYKQGCSTMFVADNEPFEGRIIGVTELGELILEVENKIRNYNFGEIRYFSKP